MIVSMSSSPPPSEPAWLRELPAALRATCEATPGLVGRLDEALAQARAARPGVTAPAAAFVAHVLARGFAEGGGQGLHVADLYLCCACLARDPRALAAFEALFVGVVESALVRMGFDGDERDEVAQSLRERLLVGVEATPPKLGEYAGRGALAGWLRAAVVRSALNATRRRRGASLDEHAWLAWPAPGDDPEIAALKRACGDDFRAAFAAAIDALEPRARLLLRQHLLDGLGIEELGAFYGVHPATTYRWIRDARATVVKATRARLAEARRLRSHELDSLLRLLESQLDASIHRLLDEPSG
jgi:RNA polymerase sigma-70 factor (ECF subfamily)